MLCLESLAQVVQRPALAVPDGHDERVPDEEHQVAELDLLGLLVVAHRLEDDEQGVVVLLDLGSLVGLEGVLDGQGVQRELGGHLGQLLGRGVVQPHPHEAAALRAGGVEGVGEVLGGHLTHPVVVERAVDDHRPIVTRRVGGRDHRPARPARPHHGQRRRRAGRLDRGRRPGRHRPHPGDRAGRPADRRTACCRGDQPAAALPGDRRPDARGARPGGAARRRPAGRGALRRLDRAAS